MQRVQIGERFGRLLVVERVASAKGSRMFRCKCDCGGEHVAAAFLLRNATIKSCGCYRRDLGETLNRTHGRRRSSEYTSWAGMIQRCEYPRHNRFHLYGGRGITVCQRWRESFESFLADMGEKPTPRHSIDRIDPDGHYGPENCRWATREEQVRNRRPHPRPARRKPIRVDPIGIEFSRAEEAAEHFGVSASLIGMLCRDGKTRDGLSFRYLDRGLGC
jgi:hypothetical protein